MENYHLKYTLFIKDGGILISQILEIPLKQLIEIKYLGNIIDLEFFGEKN